MELNYFKDKMFDLLNDADNMGIMDIAVNDKEDRILVQLAGGSVFALECRQLKRAQKKKTIAGSLCVFWKLNRDTK